MAVTYFPQILSENLKDLSFYCNSKPEVHDSFLLSLVHIQYLQLALKNVSSPKTNAVIQS